jgi:hypothetical protein
MILFIFSLIRSSGRLETIRVQGEETLIGWTNVLFFVLPEKTRQRTGEPPTTAEQFLLWLFEDFSEETKR